MFHKGVTCRPHAVVLRFPSGYVKANFSYLYNFSVLQQILIKFDIKHSFVPDLLLFLSVLEMYTGRILTPYQRFGV
jgi:hypothetical protein